MDFPNGSRFDKAVDSALTEFSKRLNLSKIPNVQEDNKTIAESAYIICSVALSEFDLESRNDMIAKFYSEFPGLLNRVVIDSEINKENMHIFVVNNIDFVFFFLKGLGDFTK